MTLSSRWLIFAVLGAGYLLVYFHRLCASVTAVDMMRDLGAGGVLIGMLAAAYFYPYALMQLPAGLLADSFGPRKTITVFFLAAAAGSVLLGLAPTAFVAIAGRALVGIGVAMLFVATMKVLAEWFAPDEFASMTGILIALGGMGSLIAMTPLALLSAAVGWRVSFILVGLFTLVLTFMIWRFVRDRPAELGLPSPVVHGPAGEKPIGLREGVRRVLSEKYFWPLALWFFFDCAIFFTIGGLWGGPYLMHVYGMTKAGAGNILSMLAVGMIVGSPALSYASNRIFRGRKPVLVLTSLGAVAAMTPLVAATGSLTTAWLYLIFFLLGVFTNAIVVIGFTAAKELFPVQIAGTSTGLVNLFPFAGGAVFQPLLGHVIEKSGKAGDAFTVAGYRDGFALLLGCAVIALAASFFVKETMER
ncbi:MAG TPA: MFS transporter [Spirochaetes bacterium]|nr:MFS transporter [Spirochaetota bacterium]